MATDFTDGPIDPVARDNIDLEVIIGKHDADNLEPGEKPSEGKPYEVTELEVELTDGSASNYATGRVIPKGHDQIPDEGDPLNRDDDPDIITIDVDNSLTENREDTDGEITRIFTGVISNSSRIRAGFAEFLAFWPAFNFIQNGSMEFEVPPIQTRDFDFGGNIFDAPTYENNLQYANNVAQEIVDKIESQTRFPASESISAGPYDINDTDYAENLRLTVFSYANAITSDEPDSGLLTRITESTNSVWTVDRYGEFHIGPPIPKERLDIPTATTSHKLRYITETSAGKQSPAYRSIVVIGDGIVSQDGWQASKQVNENPQKYSSPVTAEIDEGGSIDENLAEPTFEYTNLEINTADEAKHVLEKLKEDIKKQLAGGEVTVVGHPEVWPGDSVEMPDAENQPFAQERYTVRKVTHRLNNSDGFLTKITVGGQTNASKSLFSGDIPDDPLRYESPFTGRSDRTSLIE